MSYKEVLQGSAIAISTSESPDMGVLGLSNEHLRDAMAEIARYLLALGTRLIYGGDLRAAGFSELLFELVERHRRDTNNEDTRSGATNYLSWPVHIQLTATEIGQIMNDLQGVAELVCLDMDGGPLSMDVRRQLSQQTPTDSEWSNGLTAMRQTMLRETQARIILGGRVDKYKGRMPGIAEEALLSLQAGQPLFVMGGFGGCAYDIYETLRFIHPRSLPYRDWQGRDEFKDFKISDLSNGLTVKENHVLARTPHIDQAIALVLRGLIKLQNSSGNTGAVMAEDIKNVFVSHIHEDDAGLSNLKNLLAKSGLIIKDSSITSEKPNNAKDPNYIKNEILAPRINWAGTFLVYVTPETKNSEYVNWEIEYAAKQGKRIIGVWEQGSKDCEVPEALREYGDAVVGWNGNSIIDAILEEKDGWEKPDGTPFPDLPLKRHPC